MNHVVYVAGPITGVENYEEPFLYAAERLRAMGFVPLLPVVLPAGMTDPQYMRICFPMIDVSAMVLFLHRWPHSKGALGEYDHCNSVGKPYVCCTAPIHTDHLWEEKVKTMMEAVNQ
jgi:hypothetical protein